MLIKEYLNVVWEVCYKNKEPFKVEFLFIKNSIKNYIKDFNLKKYLKRIVFEENIFLNIFLFFILKIIYDFFMFFFYTLDIFVTFFFKWFFYVLYMSLDLWETYIFKKIYEVRKNVVRSKKYKREKALLAKKRAEFFKKFLNSFEKDLEICLNFNKRNYSIIYKYYKYYSIWIPAFFKWFRFSTRKNIPLLWKQVDNWIADILIGYYIINWFLYIQIFFLKRIKKIFIYILKAYWFIRDNSRILFYFFFNKLKIIYIAYKLRKKSRREFYRFLYINYFFLYKRNDFSVINEKDLIKYTNQAISLTFNFYSFNFKFIYFWHCYIKKIQYITYLEYFLLNNDIKHLNLKNNFRNCRILIPFNFIWLINWLSRFLTYIIPIFDKYYVKYLKIIKKYSFKYSFKLFSILSYIFSPFVFFFCLYKNSIEFYKFFSLFVKIFLKKFK